RSEAISSGFLSDHGDALHLHQHFRARQAGDGEQRARRIIVAEDLAAQLRETVAEPRIGDEDGHRHDVGEPATGFFEGMAEPGEHLAYLAVEIGGERAAGAVVGRDLTGQPDGAAAFGDDRLRIAARLGSVVLKIVALHGVWHRTLPSTVVYCRNASGTAPG